MANNKTIGISKSRYTLFRQCPKALWLSLNKPELIQIDDYTKSIMESGNKVGDLAMGLFGEYVDVTTYTNGKLDLTSMIVSTKQHLLKETSVICEASFSTEDGKYCAVDILRKVPLGYAIYEVKASTSSDKDVYVQDVAYQKYILQKCGINVVGCYLVHLDNEYRRGLDIDLNRLFSIDDISSAVDMEFVRIESDLAEIDYVTNLDEEVECEISESCHKPYDCAFWKYCSKKCGIPEKDTVFECYRMTFKKKIEHFKNGNLTFNQLLENNVKLNDKQKTQVKCTLNDETYINTEAISAFMNKLTYPLYFLDFETQNDAIPEYIGCRPYQQVPFQYSLHIASDINGLTDYEHKEFLGISGTDSRRALAEQLVKDIPMNVCSVAYNMAFEKMVIKELADEFTDLSEHLLNIREHMMDLLEPFQNGYYYVPAMRGSFSIKKVLPALFPDDPELDYHNLEGSVHNGTEAMTIYPKIQYMNEDEQLAARKSLLKYCELDTWAMVKIWQKLKEVCSL